MPREQRNNVPVILDQREILIYAIWIVTYSPFVYSLVIYISNLSSFFVSPDEIKY